MYGNYDDRTVAVILAKQKRRTATGLTWTRPRVATLRANHAIPAYQPPPAADVRPDCDDAVVVTITAAEKPLGVSKVTLYRWMKDGFITGEQITPGAPWRIRIDQALRDRIRPETPDGWLGLDEAANRLQGTEELLGGPLDLRQLRGVDPAVDQVDAHALGAGVVRRSAGGTEPLRLLGDAANHLSIA